MKRLFQLDTAVNKRLDWLYRVIEAVNFKQLFLFWMCTIVAFGFLYYFLLFFPGHGINYHGEQVKTGLDGLVTAEYYSFITSTTVGYGDVTPQGFSRLLAVLEAMAGLIIFGVVISKLVSAKQELILDEVYALSFEERLNRIRSSLFLFKKDANRIMDRTANGFSKKDTKELWIVLSALESTIADALKITSRELPAEQQRYLRSVDDFHIELITNSINASLTKLIELLVHLDLLNAQWRHVRITERIESITSVTKNFASIHLAKTPPPKLTSRLEELTLLSQELPIFLQQTQRTKEELAAQLMKWVEGES